MRCPHCLEHFREIWSYTRIGQDREQLWGTGSTTCAACNRIIITLGAVASNNPNIPVHPHNHDNFRLVQPRGISRSPIPPEIPPEFVKDYSEACLVLPDSEKASAALSRRCLQHLLRGKAGVKNGDLATEIQEVLDKKQLPGHLADDLDAIRNVGNFAAHPMKSKHTGQIMDVEPQEAEWSLDVLEGLFDFYFIQPARSKTKRDALDAKLRSAGKPPMKTS